MSLTVTKVFGPIPVGDRWMTVHKVDFDTSYPTNGESLTRADLGFASTADDEFHVEPSPRAGYVPVYDHTDQKLLLYIGKDPGAAGGADVVLQQVGNTIDASACAGMRVTAYGRFAA